MNISGNCFKLEDKKLIELKSLRKLNLGFNHLEKFWSFPTNIEILILNNNKICNLENYLPQMKNLKYLDLDNNFITNISNLTSLKQIQFLFLKNNKVYYYSLFFFIYLLKIII